MRVIDVHCHLENEQFDADRAALLDAARAAGVAGWVTAAWQPQVWADSRRVAREHQGVLCALGMHPWYVRDEHRELLDALGEALQQGAAAVGEIGLDSRIDGVPMPLQEALFVAQLGLARDLNLPVVVHCRGAFNELLRVARAVGLPSRGGVIHAFSGSPELADDLIAAGFSMSLGGALTYRNSRKRERVLRRIFPDHFMLETDCPDLPPIEAGSGRNEPANIVYNLRAAAELLCETEERVAAATSANAARMFGFDVAE